MLDNALAIVAALVAVGALVRVFMLVGQLGQG